MRSRCSNRESTLRGSTVCRHSDPHLRDHDVYEVFSRGQNPQHWYVAKRRVEMTEQFDQGQVYMEIARKESTLADADNEVAAVVREFADHRDGWDMLTRS